MPSPVGHTLAGLSICYAIFPNRKSPLILMVVAVIAANLPDMDFLPGIFSVNSVYDAFHRGASHSLLFSLAASLFGWFIFHFESPIKLTQAAAIWTVAIFSHLFLDWLSADTGPPVGIPLLWPWSSQHFISSPTIFHSIERDNLFTAEIITHNIIALSVELLILSPVLFICWRLSQARKSSC